MFTEVVHGEIHQYDQGLEVILEGYGDAASEPGYGVPIFIELYQGTIQVRLWTNIDHEDPESHSPKVISLEKAKEDWPFSLTNRPTPSSGLDIRATFQSGGDLVIRKDSKYGVSVEDRILNRISRFNFNSPFSCLEYLATIAESIGNPVVSWEYIEEEVQS
jgi:hypothetical protein